MPRYVIKVNKEDDVYVEWSTIVDAPICWGTRDQMLEMLVNDAKEKEEYARPEAEKRLARADANGTSAFDWRDGGWDGEYLMYEQEGLLPRTKLMAFLESFNEPEQSFDLSLLKPFED